VSRPTATLGIDLASQAKNTGFCAIEWVNGRGVVRVLTTASHQGAALHDKFLVTAINGLRLVELGEASISKTGIDAPLGWPEPFVDALAAHHGGEGWPSLIDHGRSAFERRETDRFVHGRSGRTPLSVSTDKIAYPAMRAAVLLADLARRHGPAAVDRSGAGMICEVYPDPALRHWTHGRPDGLVGREGYKATPLIERRRQLTTILQEGARLSDPEWLLNRCSEDDHCLDALVCALVARASVLGRTLAPRDPETQRLATYEGWIHLPDCDLAALPADG